MTSVIDEPRDVRDEDAFDVAAAHGWLASRSDELERDDPLPQVRQFAGGASNLTYLLTYPDRELILRRPPRGTKAATAHDMRREYDVMAGLGPVFGYVPETSAFCADPSIIGSEFYLMERLVGVILRAEPPEGLELDPTTANRLCASVVDTSVALHEVDPGETRLADLGPGEGYVRRHRIIGRG